MKTKRFAATNVEPITGISAESTPAAKAEKLKVIAAAIRADRLRRLIARTRSRCCCRQSRYRKALRLFPARICRRALRHARQRLRSRELLQHYQSIQRNVSARL